MRSLKFLFLVVTAALALGAATAGESFADVLTAEGGPVTLTGAQEGTGDVVGVDGGQVKCNTVTFVGTASASGVTQIAVSPTFSGCTFAGLSSSVNVNGCTFLITLNTEAGNTTSTLDIQCAAGKEVTVTAPSVGTPKCILHLPAQNGIGSSAVKNIGAGTTKEITVTLNLTKVAYSQTKGTAESGNCATADNTTNGTYGGTETFTGEISGTHIGIFLS